MSYNKWRGSINHPGLTLRITGQVFMNEKNPTLYLIFKWHFQAIVTYYTNGNLIWIFFPLSGVPQVIVMDNAGFNGGGRVTLDT